MRRYALALILFHALLLGGIVGYASTTVSSPVYGDTSKVYTLGYEAVIIYNNQNVSVASASVSLGQGPRVGGVSIVNNIAYQGLANNYKFVYNVNGTNSVVIVPPPEKEIIEKVVEVERPCPPAPQCPITQEPPSPPEPPMAPTRVEVDSGGGVSLGAAAAALGLLLLLGAVMLARGGR